MHMLNERNGYILAGLMFAVLGAGGTGFAEAVLESVPCQPMAECKAVQDANDPSVRLVVEAGFLGVLAHTIQFSNFGTRFSYPADGGQDVLFPVTRFSVEAALDPRQRFVFLYQPLELDTQETLRNDLQVDDTLFPAGTPVHFRYSFPFYRLSYLYDLAPEADQELSLGFSMQIRNATIEFSDLAGAALTHTNDIGLVPLLKFRLRQPMGGKWWWGSEIDGIYAPVSYLNGSDTEIVGALLDASGRIGLDLEQGRQVFLNVRYLGGGAVGTNDDGNEPGDGYVNNWLQFLIVSLGFSMDLF